MDLNGNAIAVSNDVWDGMKSHIPKRSDGNPEKVFGITKEFTEKHPNTTVRLTNALIRAAMWLDAEDNATRPEAVEILSQHHYVGADEAVIGNSMTGTFEYEKGDVRDVPDFNVFFRYNAT